MKPRDGLLIAPVAGATFLAFLPALVNGFVAWDDRMNLVYNPDFSGLDGRHLRWMFTTFFGGPYQPLSWLSFAVDHRFWGMDPRGYHLTNLLLHSANAVVFYLAALILLRKAVPDATEEDRAKTRLAAGAAALLFSLHPLRVESVAWATERKDLLSAFFYLSSVLAYLRRLEALILS